ncbi:hypothetical protein ACQKPX_12705 [Photobacterium sp. DNB23_23_1]|uniref:Uncharacterized protein n=1 Tax=Photobacterium pectinilyticum TaxID=2906793 RepID=A0ABT1NB45_9GAMM|nr:hypothetical protein [Photobacterium sp. ZSDE20]MCQ1060911.1 hypothetical protein [Photobacterium sp. ZSDE20]MDD1828802.1 hypothetical protein [Photobacterium sp. ZSDE20]
MAERLKRINYSIYLDPLNNPADLYASKVLHQWADDFTRLKAESAEENGLALLNARNVQKQVYLSGLFMHLLSPDLSQQLSLQVTESQVSELTLENTLQGLGFLVKNSPQEFNQEAQTALFEALKASISEQVKSEAKLTREYISSSERRTNSVEAESKDEAVIGSIDQLSDQNAKLVAMIDSQSQQIAELKNQLTAQTALIRTLSQRSTSRQDEPPGNPSPVVDLNERLAHVQKIKKKGIF